MVRYIREQYCTCGLILCCFTSASASFVNLTPGLTPESTGTSRLVTLELFPESPSHSRVSSSQAQSPAISGQEQGHPISSSSPPDLEFSLGLPSASRSVPNLSQYAAFETELRSSYPVRSAGQGSSSGHATNVLSPVVNPLAHPGVRHTESNVHLSKSEAVSVIICPTTKPSSTSNENRTGDVSIKGQEKPAELHGPGRNQGNVSDIILEDAFSMKFEPMFGSHHPTHGQLPKSNARGARMTKSPFYEACINFDTQIDSKDLRIERDFGKTPHRQYRLAKFGREGQDSYIIRVLKSRNNSAQPLDNLKALYKILIGCLYESFLSLLDRMLLQIVTYKLEFSNLLSWLNEQIFSPKDSVGLFCVCQEKMVEWKVGTVQVHLIDFFSGETEANIGPIIAPRLIREYFSNFQACTHQPTGRFSESDFSMEKFNLNKGYDIRIDVDLTFLKRMKALFTVVEASALKRFSFQNYCANPEEHQLITSTWGHYINNPDQKIDPGQIKVTKVHPLIPISVSRVGKKNLIRILSRKNQLPLRSFNFSQLLLKLLQVTDHIHQGFLKSLNIEETEAVERRKTLLKGLLKSLEDPEDGQPIIGESKRIELNVPWEGLKSDFAAINLYKPIQLLIIKYFHEGYIYPNTIVFGAFVVASWYQKTHPEYFPNFMHRNRDQSGFFHRYWLSKNFRKRTYFHPYKKNHQ